MQELVFDTRDAAGVARFWSDLLGAPWAMVFDPEWAVVEARGLRLAFQRVPEGKESAKNRLHLDVQVDDLAAGLARVEALGGRATGGVRHEGDGTGFIVCVDVDDNEFCLVLDAAGAYDRRVRDAVGAANPLVVRPCKPYRATTAGRVRLDLPDGSAFKVYFADITGRDDRARYEWAHAPLTQAGFEAAFRAGGVRGVGFVVAFPHITKVFRFSPDAETILDVRALNTRTLAPLDLARADGYTEFACYAEALIAADEYRAWAEASTVADYLAAWSGFADAPVTSSDKLLRHWTR